MALTPTARANDSPSAYDSESSEQRSFLGLMKSWSHRGKLFSGRDGSKSQPPPPGIALSGQSPGIQTKRPARVASLSPAARQPKKEDPVRDDGLGGAVPKSLHRRAFSADGQWPGRQRMRSPVPVDEAGLSAPMVHSIGEEEPPSAELPLSPISPSQSEDLAARSSLISQPSQALTDSTFPRESLASLKHTQSNGDCTDNASAHVDDDLEPDDLRDDEDDDGDELDDRWILNLSMHFREKTPREKFFITYAQAPNLWRRITVSVDYRNASYNSLEWDLQNLLYQREKSARIYESISTSLPDIEFFDTVTNLRLETSDDDRLHVHVTEDVNEIIPYPPSSLLDHVDIPRFSEEDVNFQSHMSGFVYKVQVEGEELIKKEIPGPDSVEEFLYEINALYNLRGKKNVIQFKGLVVDERLDVVKGILIAYAEKGPLVDIIYDYAGHLTWECRERWAMEIVNGLSEIHEAGFVQGDFTLSNIVIDENDTATIIDINRRGCPVGWEPPEIATMITSGQRISMYIGVKSDLFQLGMVLWALAEQIDEPERQLRPLGPLGDAVPQYYREIVAACLETDPRKRIAAKELCSRFPPIESELLMSPPWSTAEHRTPHSGHSQTEYIDPAAAVGLEDIENRSQNGGSPSRTGSVSRRFWSSHTAYESRPSSVGSTHHQAASCIVPRRGRSPPANMAHVTATPFRRRSDDPHSPSEASPGPQIVAVSPSDEHKREEFFGVDGRPFLVEMDESAEERQQRLQRSQERMRPSLNEAVMQPSFNHVDSGLGDMGGISREGTETDLDSRRVRRHNTAGMQAFEHVDSGLADMDELAGMGENETLRDYRKDYELDEGPLGRRGGDLVPLNEYEVVENFGGDEQSPQGTIAAVDRAFPEHGEGTHDGKALPADPGAGPSRQHAPATGNGSAALPTQASSSEQHCKYS